MIKRIIASVVLAVFAIPVFAVTDKEMEEAIPITAHAIL